MQSLKSLLNKFASMISANDIFIAFGIGLIGAGCYKIEPYIAALAVGSIFLGMGLFGKK
jgi:hypothetical protein